MNRLDIVKFKDNRTSIPPISLKFTPISIELKTAYAEFSQFVWDYMGTTKNPPIRELNRLLMHWLYTDDNTLRLKGSSKEDIEPILDLITFLSELQAKSKELEFYEDEGSNAFNYVNSQPDIEEVDRD